MVLRSQPVASQKFESWWLGPAKIKARVGKDSYRVVHKPGELWEVHLNFLKPYIKDDIMGTGVPLYYHKGTTRSSVLSGTDDMVYKIENYRDNNGKLEFLVKWKDEPNKSVWVPSISFFQNCSSKWVDFVTSINLEVNITHLFS